MTAKYRISPELMLVRIMYIMLNLAEFRTLTHSRQMNNGMTHKRFRSLTAEMIMAFYQIITPGSISKKNPFNPFPAIAFKLWIACQ